MQRRSKVTCRGNGVFFTLLHCRRPGSRMSSISSADWSQSPARGPRAAARMAPASRATRKKVFGGRGYGGTSTLAMWGAYTLAQIGAQNLSSQMTSRELRDHTLGGRLAGVIGARRRVLARNGLPKNLALVDDRHARADGALTSPFSPCSSIAKKGRQFY